jgi:hypothetical protein
VFLELEWLWLSKLLSLQFLQHSFLQLIVWFQVINVLRQQFLLVLQQPLFVIGTLMPNKA